MCGAYRVGPERARPATPMLLEAFGPARLMWGSDWPPMDTGLDRVTTYRQTMGWFEEWVPCAAARRKILVDTPAALYGF